MGATESWFFIKEGRVYYHTENDGWAAMRRGLEKNDQDLGTVEEARKKYLKQDLIPNFRNSYRLKELLKEQEKNEHE